MILLLLLILKLTLIQCNKDTIVLLAGVVRTFPITVKSIYDHLIKPYNADVGACIWQSFEIKAEQYSNIELVNKLFSDVGIELSFLIAFGKSDVIFFENMINEQDV